MTGVKRPRLILLVVICLVLLPSVHKAGAVTETGVLYGRVLDSRTGQPLSNAKIVIWTIEGSKVVQADVSGRYEERVALGSCRVYAICDYEDTPGFDYVPAFQDVLLASGDSVDVSFKLTPGASVEVVGTVNSVKTGQNQRTIILTVILGNQPAEEVRFIFTYGSTLSSQVLGLTDRVVIVPAGASVKIRSDIYFPDASTLNLTMNDGIFLSQGDLMSFNIEKYTLKTDINFTGTYIGSVEDLLKEAEVRGFYVAWERRSLERAGNLVRDASISLYMAQYSECYAGLREAYILANSVKADIYNLFDEASRSAVFITPFLAFTAVILSALMVSTDHQRLMLSLLLYVVLVGFLYLFYPGYSLVPQMILIHVPSDAPVVLSSLLLFAVFFSSFIIVLFTIQRLRTHGVFFSMSARYLTIRKLRTFLVLTQLAVSIFAFIALTSFSVELGLVLEKHTHASAPTSGLLIRNIGITPGRFMGIPAHWTGARATILPVSSEILGWIRDRPEVDLVAPKVENFPHEPAGPLCIIRVPGHWWPAWGIIGILPSAEAKVTHIDKTIVEGRYLQDDGLTEIMMSVKAASILNIGVNETLQMAGKNFTLVGIFDDEEFNLVRDLDGSSPVPRKLEEIEPAEAPLVTPCKSQEIVIMHWTTALTLEHEIWGQEEKELLEKVKPMIWREEEKEEEAEPMILSRLAILVKNPEDILSLGRLIVLKLTGYTAFASVNGLIYQMLVGPYYEISGFGFTVVPLAITSLSVFVLALASVHERRSEMRMLSTLGLSPSHMAYLLITEAITLGLIGGSIGYLLGLSSYRVMTLISAPLYVKQKVESIWSMLSLFLAIWVAILGYLLPATKASTIITPSLLRKWRLRKKPLDPYKPLVVEMPVAVPEGIIEDFLDYSERRLRGLERGFVERVESIERSATALRFKYIVRGLDKIDTYTSNELHVVRSRGSSKYKVNLVSKVEGPIFTLEHSRSQVEVTSYFVRQIILEWSFNSSGERETLGTAPP